ncbi:hypothetical protein CLV63_12457 [Murinocardiopsis flavida]|uniref:Uncharacterized protein n=1 Tax=Murinocardiopsis flavida TaxID=645275 RepID=A0A2P8CYB8_9ACTN|nr:hypothetical protein [Murinocardiopsis flavida]PSK89953.1 hypothetical protein CLV63_12457 [Murinocardiopsis flavida]
MSRLTSDAAPMVGAAVDPGADRVMAWVSAPGHLAHLIPLAPATARQWAAQLRQAADAADTPPEDDQGK